MTKQLEQLLESNQATIAVIGQGYVGLPLALAFVDSGFPVAGIDIDRERVASLERGTSYVTDVDDAEIRGALETGRYRATTDYAETASADVVCICVPTPLRKTRDPDISYIRDAAERMRDHLTEPVLVVLESTTYPGTTKEVLEPMLRDGKSETQNEEIFVAFSPERVDPGNEEYGVQNTPKVVGGTTETATRLASKLYRELAGAVHPLPSASEAEMVKLLENTFRAVNIGLVNEMAIMCDRMNLDIWRIVEAASTKPFGFMPFYPGPGIGGHCIPLDPTYLSWRAKSFGFYTRFIELADDINTNMPRFVVQKLTRRLNEEAKPLNGSDILLLGVAYKPDVSDIRESPALDIWQLLEDRGARISYHDPHVPVLDTLESAESIELTDESLQNSDAVVICTDHSSIDYERVAERATVVLDARDALPDGYPSVTKL